MKVLYIGSICNESEFEATSSRSKTKVSFAPQHFEASILKGLSSVRDVELMCISAECIATYPHGSKFYLSERTDDLGNGLTSKIAHVINLPFIKPKCMLMQLVGWLRNGCVRIKVQMTNAYSCMASILRLPKRPMKSVRNTDANVLR